MHFILLGMVLQVVGDNGGQNFTISSNANISGEYYNIGTITINSGVTITCTGDVVIRAEKIVVGGVITANGANNSEDGGDGSNGQGTNNTGGGGGAGHSGAGGAGGDGDAGANAGGAAGGTYTTTANPSFTVASSPDSADDLDSPGGLLTLREGSEGGNGGGGSGGAGGAGGGRIMLYASVSINISGTISANGNDGSDGSGNKGGGGGGSGGGIVIASPSVTLTGTLSINGGDGGDGTGGNSGGGGGGGGGGIRKLYDTLTDTATTTVSEGTGGNGNNSGSNGANGSAGATQTSTINFRPGNSATFTISGSVTSNSVIYIADSTPDFSVSGFSDPNTSSNVSTWGSHAASRWQIRSDSGSFDSPVADSNYASSDLASFTPSSLSDGTYHIKIRYVDHGDTSGYGGTSSAPSSSDDELEGVWSSSQKFIVDTEAPSSPSANTPSTGVTLSSTAVSFDWSTSSDTTSGVKDYTLEILDKSGNILQTVVTTSTSSTVSLSNGSYKWRVLATDNAGNKSPFSSEQTFSVGGSSTLPVLVSPVNETVGRDVLFEWTIGDKSGVDTFKLIITDKDTGEVVRAEETNSTSLTVFDLPRGVFTWRVIARLLSGLEEGSSAEEFITVVGPRGEKCSMVSVHGGDYGSFYICIVAISSVMLLMLRGNTTPEKKSGVTEK